MPWCQAAVRHLPETIRTPHCKNAHDAQCAGMTSLCGNRPCWRLRGHPFGLSTASWWGRIGQKTPHCYHASFSPICSYFGHKRKWFRSNVAVVWFFVNLQSLGMIEHWWNCKFWHCIWIFDSTLFRLSSEKSFHKWTIISHSNPPRVQNELVKWRAQSFSVVPAFSGQRRKKGTTSVLKSGLGVF